MTEINRIVAQMQLAFNGKAWHGPSLQKTLANVDAVHAAAKPVANAHSVWELVLHITAWQRIVTRRVAGEQVSEVADEEDWPPVRAVSEQAWQNALQELEQQHHNLCAAALRLHESDLFKIIRSADGEYTMYATLHGVIQHILYHAGQIMLLRKAM